MNPNAPNQRPGGTAPMPPPPSPAPMGQYPPLGAPPDYTVPAAPAYLPPPPPPPVARYAPPVVAAPAGPGAQQGQAPTPGGAGATSGDKLSPTWPAALVLYLLAPIVAELLTGSTPPLAFINPLTLFFLAAIYGTSALLGREIVRRQQLGWGSVVLLGAAFGVLNEGLIVTSWTNPYWPDVLSLGMYSRAWGINWYWAEGLTVFHAIISFTIPIILVEAIFPSVAERPWLGKWSVRALVVWLALISVAGFALVGLSFRSKGYTPPLPQMLAILAIGVAFVALATHPIRLRLRKSSAPVIVARPAPRVGKLRVYSFLITVLFFILHWGAAPIIHSAPVLMALMGAVVLFAVWRVHRWGGALGWGARQRLALASGALFFFILLAPASEFLTHPAGRDEQYLTAVALVVFIGLIILARYARHTEAKRLGANTNAIT